MKIAIEAQRIFRKEKHGMDYVALENIRELQKIDQQNEYFILVSPGDDICLQESANMHIVTVNWPSYPLWEQIGLPLALKKIKPDLLHCTSNTAPVYGNIPLVLTLHDIIFLEKKQGKNQSMYQRLGRFYRKIIVPQIPYQMQKNQLPFLILNATCISHFLHIDKQTACRRIQRLFTTFHTHTERTGHHCPIHKEPSLPVLFRKYRSQEEYGKGIAGIPQFI